MPFVIEHGNIGDALALAREAGRGAGVLQREQILQQRRAQAAREQDLAARRELEQIQMAMADKRAAQQARQSEQSQQLRLVEMLAQQKRAQRSQEAQAQQFAQQMGLRQQQEERLRRQQELQYGPDEDQEWRKYSRLNTALSRREGAIRQQIEMAQEKLQSAADPFMLKMGQVEPAKGQDQQFQEARQTLQRLRGQRQEILQNLGELQQFYDTRLPAMARRGGGQAELVGPDGGGGAPPPSLMTPEEKIGVAQSVVATLSPTMLQSNPSLAIEKAWAKVSAIAQMTRMPEGWVDEIMQMVQQQMRGQ